MIAGAEAEQPASDAEVEEALSKLVSEGIAAREAVARVAGATGRSRRDVYRRLLRLSGPGGRRAEGATGQD